MSLQGKVAIVTGGARGIGASIVKALAGEGASVSFNYVSDSSAKIAEELVSSIKSSAVGNATAIQAELSGLSAPDKLVKATLEAFGVDYIDILVNNAATNMDEPLANLKLESYNTVMNLNVRAVILLTQAVLPYIKPERGANRIINLSSVSARGGFPTQTVYAASKAALEGFTRVWARELGHSHNLTANAINPGPVDTEMLRSVPDHFKVMIEEINKTVPAAPRVGEVEDISDIVIFLASEKSRWVTGQVFGGNGGLLMI